MSRIPDLAKRAGLAMMAASGLIVGAGITVRFLDPGPPAAAAIGRVMTGHDAHHLAAQPAAAAANEVVIDNFSFGPATLAVAAGTKVVWTNRDDDPHTVVSAADPKLFKSTPLDTGDSFSTSFDKPGTYRYFCSIHPHMQGTVVVQ
jgi:plastocyanin